MVCVTFMTNDGPVALRCSLSCTGVRAGQGISETHSLFGCIGENEGSDILLPPHTILNQIAT